MVAHRKPYILKIIRRNTPLKSFILNIRYLLLTYLERRFPDMGKRRFYIRRYSTYYQKSRDDSIKH